MWANASCAQTLSPYSDFQGLNQPELGTLQGKLTLLGTREHRTYTLAFDTFGHTLDISVFRPFYRAEFVGGYTMDFSSPKAFKASTSQLAALIDSVSQVPSITDGGVDPSGALSFSMSVVKSGVTKVFESVLDTTDSRLLFGRMLGALATNQDGAAAVTKFACFLGLLPGPTIADMTPSVSLVTRGFRKDRASGQYVGKVRVTNTGAQALSAPVLLAFQPGENITVVNGGGFTCAAFPSSPYVVLPVGTALAPGQHVDMVLRFNNPDDDRIVLSAQRVYAGPGFH